MRLLEQRGPLEDSAALRHAAAQGAYGAGHAAQIALRASLLGERLGLQSHLQRARQAAPWVLALIAALMVLTGALLAGAVVDAQDRRINVLGALVALLGIHALTFLLWLLTLLWPGTGAGLSGGAASLWAKLTARLTLGRGAEAQALVQAGTQLFNRARLLPWLGGLVSHTLWALSLAAAMGALLFALAFKRYTLGWESTLLAPDTLARAVQVLGLLPGWLGFAMPDAALLQSTQASLAPERDRQLAWWLIGCVTVYGLLPRLLALAGCALMWRLRRSALPPDFSRPYYRELITRLDALAPATVVDADTARHDWDLSRHSFAADSQDGWAVLGFELPPEHPWPPAPLPTPLLLQMRIDGSAVERQQLLQQLSELRPRWLVLSVSARSSPDRGTERFLRELLPLCGECRLWLSSQSLEPDGAARWQRWLSDHGLHDVHAFVDWADASRDPIHPTTSTSTSTPASS